MKQVIVLRKDLNMRKGKMIAQGAHASLGAVLPNQHDVRVKEWLAGPFAKIVVSVNSQQELEKVLADAQEAGLIHCRIDDHGLTEFHGVETFTCVAVGPDTDDRLYPVTGHLPLL